MTTDARDICRVAGGCRAVACHPRRTDATRRPWPSTEMLAALPAGAAVVSTGPVSVTLRGEPGLVAALFAAGAEMALPAGLAGCLPQGI